MIKRLIALMLVLFLFVGTASAASVFVRLNPGDSISVECVSGQPSVESGESGVVDISCADLPTATVEATVAPTETPVATSTPTPMTHSMEDMLWHSPGAHGDRPAHEHGDAPPQWLINAGYSLMFTHAANTPNENHPYWKHTGFKGWSGVFNDGQPWYGIFHLDFNPGGHASRFHSYQLWIQTQSGDVSHFQGWMDFGVNNNSGPNLVVVCGTDSGIRPIILVNQSGCAPRFENWYSAAASNGRAPYWPDLGFNISPNYFHGGDPLDPGTWDDIFGYPSNANRRVEFAWYANRSNVRGEFWTTQFGDRVSGPGDPLCGSTKNYGDRSYTIACLRQYIAPDMQSIEFPGNAIQRTFPDDGVVLPN